MSQVETIRWLLKFIFDLFKDFLGIKSMMDESNEPYIKNMFLLGSKEVSSKFGVYKFIVFNEILGHNFNPRIFGLYK